MEPKQRTRCRICKRPALRRAIDAELICGSPQRVLARDFRISQALIHRHKRCRRVRFAGDDHPARLEQIARWLEILSGEVRRLRFPEGVKS